ncbi:MAG TPA: hypothetical protein VEY71_06445 [Chitinophagales bacterium]|nr:hypothetical protein [Chitinophagales bacterium]
MKSILATMLLFAFTAGAQQVRMEYGPLAEIPKGGKGVYPEAGVLRYFNIYGSATDRFVHYQIANNEYTAHVNPDLSVLPPTEVSIPWPEDVADRGAPLRQQGNYWLDDRLLRFIGGYNKTLKKYVLYAVIMNGNGTYANTVLPLDTFDIRQAGGVESFVAASPDQSKFLVYAVPFGNEKDINFISLKCFDAGLNPLYRTRLPADRYDVNTFGDCAVDNNGNAVASFGARNAVYNASTKALNDVETKEGTMAGAFVFDNRGRLFLASPLLEGQFSLARFNALLTDFDFSANPVEPSLSTKEFSGKLFRLREIVSHGDSDMLILYEQSDTVYGTKKWNPDLSAANVTRWGRGTFESPTVKTPNYYFSDNLIAIGLTVNGATAKINYAVDMAKSQVSTHRSLFMNSFTALDGEHLYIFFNDNFSNEPLRTYKEMKPFRAPRFGIDDSEKDGLAYARLNLKSGTWSKHNLGTPENHLLVQINSATQTGDREWLVRSALNKADDYRLVRLRFE